MGGRKTDVNQLQTFHFLSNLTLKETLVVRMIHLAKKETILLVLQQVMWQHDLVIA